MSAQTDHGVRGGVQADITLERSPVPLALSAAAPGPPAVPVTAALPARDSASASRRAVTRGPRIRGLHDSPVYFPAALICERALESSQLRRVASPDMTSDLTSASGPGKETAQMEEFSVNFFFPNK